MAAAYPNSVFAGPTINNGDVIDAADPTRAYDELTALEDALLNGPLTIKGIAYTFPSSDGTAGQALTTNGSATLSWDTVVSKPFVQWTALGNQPPASAYATPDTRNSHPVLDFDGTSDEEAVFGGVLPTSYAGGGVTCDLWVAFTSATTGTVRFQVAFERDDVSSVDLDSDSFAAFQSAGGSVPGTSGQLILISIPFTDGAQMDGLLAGEAFRLKVRRDADGTSGTDDVTTDAELFRVVLRET